MSDETKEILQLIGNCHYCGEISEDKYEEYYNYITNLQKEKPTLYTDTNWEDLLEYNGMKWISTDRFKELQDEIQNLRGSLKTYEILLKANVEENERLKEQLFDFEQNIYIQKAGIPQKLTKDKTFMELYDMPTYEDYKSRCEKAIPMLKELNKKLKDILHIGIDIAEITDIENTLTGGDKE